MKLRTENQKETQDAQIDENVLKENWMPQKGLDLNAVGIRNENKKTRQLNEMKLIRGNGPIYANLAVIRMLGGAYGTPCPIDVIEKALEGAADRADSVPLQGMGQLAETMGLQTQVGEVHVEKIRRLELPVITKWEAHYALITDAEEGYVRLADPEKGWIELNKSEIQEAFGESIKVILLKRLKDTPTKTFGWDCTPVLRSLRYH